MLYQLPRKKQHTPESYATKVLKEIGRFIAQPLVAAVVRLSLSESKIEMVKWGQQIETHNLRKEIVEGLGVEREIDIVQGYVSYDLDGVYTSPDCLHVHLKERREYDVEQGGRFGLCTDIAERLS